VVKATSPLLQSWWRSVGLVARQPGLIRAVSAMAVFGVVSMAAVTWTVMQDG